MICLGTDMEIGFTIHDYTYVNAAMTLREACNRYPELAEIYSTSCYFDILEICSERNKTSNKNNVMIIVDYKKSTGD